MYSLSVPISELDRFWSLEQIGIASDESHLTKEEYKAQTLQDKVTFYDKKNKTWYTELLFKGRPPQLQSNKGKAMAILAKVEKSAIEKKQVQLINNAYQELLDNGFAEEVIEEQEPEEVHYLPGHPVFREESVSTKTRIVFNASCVSASGKSINQCLYQGPCLLPEIAHVIIRWRMMIIAFVLDITKMFLRIKLSKDKDYLRFLWRFCKTDMAARIFRMIAVTFGVISSPFQANDVVKKHCDMLEDEFPMAVTEVRNQIYVDDLAGGENDENSAKKMIEEIWKFFLEANMQPHKFASNNQKILESIPVEFKGIEDIVKVLGVLWNKKTDVLTFNIQQKENLKCEQDTKRSFLEYSASIYDPLGMLAPFTMKIKLLFQEVWLSEEKEKSRSKKGWDTKLPLEIQEKWNVLKDEIPKLNTVEIPRCFFTSNGKPLKIQLFAFGDASINAYATAIYIVGIHENGTITSNLAFSKTRIAPLTMIKKMEERQSIVRLELLSALITARAVTYVQQAIEKKQLVTDIFCFTDSLINLCRIRKGPERYKMWVANRLSEILQLTRQEQWTHCAGPQNPADLPSRGLSVQELKQSKLWWNGPDFIKQDKSTWPTTAEIKLFDDPESKKKPTEENFDDMVATIVTNLNTDESKSTNLDWNFIKTLILRYENWFKTLKLIAFILRLGLKAHKKFQKEEFRTDEKQKTESFLWSLTQRQHYPNEYQKLASSQRIAEKSPLSCYNPEFDVQENIIRSNTRLLFSNLPTETKKAIILPKNCPIVEKYIMELHNANYHAKTGYLHSVLKERFIIPQGRNQIKKAIRKCTKRKCVDPRPLVQQEAPLPSLRTDDPSPFKSVSVDLFGPMIVHHKCEFHECPHPREQSVHGALFTCFHSRAVHLEVVDSTGTESFINAFRSFTARRGIPTTMYSDNAKGFKAASKEVRALYRSINWNKIKEDGTKKSIDWFFSTEKAPHQNGLCERLVRTVKTPLRIAIGAARLTKNQLAITLTEIEAVVNNRPLCLTTNSPEDLIPITPMELVNGRKLDQLPDPNNRKNVTTFQHLWRKRQAILNQFWKRWHNDYLMSQNIRKIWKSPTSENLIDKLVLIREDNLSRNEWKIGRIAETIPSKDGLIRNVVVKTQSSTLKRPVQKLALFENY